jgi:predicted ribosomally synthesized peptide with SipW-like signal peptide
MAKRKSNKKKVTSLILLLLLSIVMLGTTTYAWFTANQVVTINSINVKVEASNGLQISTNAAQWKSVITNSDILAGYTGSVNQFPIYVTNVSTDSTVDQTTGRLNMYRAVVGNDATTGDYNIYTAKETDTAGSTGNYVAFDIFLRVDKTQTIYLTSDSDVVAKEGTEDRGLKNAARIAFVTLGHGESTDSVSALTGLRNNVSAKALIWEPNADAHTQMVSDTVAPEYGVTLVAGANTPYYGVNKVIPTPTNLKELVNGTNTSDATLVNPGIVTKEVNSVYKEAFDLAAGVTKMRIYMWIEGQDIDCENNATGSDIEFNLQLSTESGD